MTRSGSRTGIHPGMKPLIAASALVVLFVLSPLAFVVLIAAPGASSSGTALPAAAAAYCYEYGADTPRILAAIRHQESSGDYTAQSATSTASGAYQFIRATWTRYAQLAGIDTATYPNAKDAPPSTQDHVAALMVNDILDRHDGRVSSVPINWYLGQEPHPDSPAWDTIPPGNAITPRTYVTRWLDTYHQLGTDHSGIPDAFCTTTSHPGDPLQPLIDDTGRAWSVPVAADAFHPAQINAPHHTYPAWDLIIPEGIPIYAITSGTVTSTRTWPHNWWHVGCGTSGTGRPDCDTCGIGVTITTDDLRHTYCHASALHVGLGDTIAAGQQIALSGNTGRSGTPHLHLELRRNGIRYCPQPTLQALYTGNPGPFTWTTTGCTF